MKRINITALVVAYFMMSCIPCGNAMAEDIFPNFTTSIIRLYIPIEIVKFGHQEDLENEVGFNFSYNINGQFFTEEGEGHIQSLAEGFSGTSDRGTPWKTLTELFAAYQNKDINAVKSLYTVNSQSIINNILSDPNANQKFTEYIAAIKGMKILIGFEHKNGFVAFVDLDFGDSTGGDRYKLMPFFFVKVGSQYVLSSETKLDEPITANISLFLQLEHNTTKLAAPKHGLTIAKTGSGTGIVKGSGINCGDDCLEVYVEGTAVWLKAFPDEYSTFEGWLVDGEILTGRFVLKEDTVLTAVFEKIPPKKYTLTIEKSGSGDGIVMDSAAACETAECLKLFTLYADEEEAPIVESGIDCGESCSVTYLEGTTVYLEAIAAEGSEFVEWQVNGESMKTLPEITEDLVVTAVFDTVTPPEEEQPEEPQPEETQP